MIVKLFKPQFAPLVESGAKRQTIRPIPKRMPRAGDAISLRTWTGRPYCSKQRILCESVITSVSKISIRKDIISVEGAAARDQIDDIARADGFSDTNAMEAWFENEHGLPFQGILIRWE